MASSYRQALARIGAGQTIGGRFDITLPVRSYNFLVPQYDVSLMQGILAIRP